MAVMWLPGLLADWLSPVGLAIVVLLVSSLLVTVGGRRRRRPLLIEAGGRQVEAAASHGQDSCDVDARSSVSTASTTDNSAASANDVEAAYTPQGVEKAEIARQSWLDKLADAANAFCQPASGVQNASRRQPKKARLVSSSPTIVALSTEEELGGDRSLAKDKRLASAPAVVTPSRRRTHDALCLVIRDYDWTLQYKVNLLPDGSALDTEQPLQMHWVKLKTPFKSSEHLISAEAKENYLWDQLEEPQNRGFKYKVCNLSQPEDAFSGPEAEVVINLLDGRGCFLLVSKEKGIRVVDKNKYSEKEVAAIVAKGGKCTGEDPVSVSHVWVQLRSLYFPILQQLQFLDGAETVSLWKS
eukprot:TRINITY_DN35753_c0_g1_i1.p1 TRINITY_DN35753_c0_g1~~TRINITY_DN35753_c0_g1_i1.p1  ORF type:complete len:356 (+),score=95.28 TRINITY_DN35753_c0_g1_i1:137-1204(+)